MSPRRSAAISFLLVMMALRRFIAFLKTLDLNLRRAPTLVGIEPWGRPVAVVGWPLGLSLDRSLGTCVRPTSRRGLRLRLRSLAGVRLGR